MLALPDIVVDNGFPGRQAVQHRLAELGLVADEIWTPAKKYVLLELTGGNQARELRCAQLVAEDDTVHVIPIPDGMTPEQFRAKVHALGIKRFKHGNFFAARQEIPWMESLLGQLQYEGKTEWSLPASGPIIYGPSVIKFTVTSRYFRCIPKIGFHYFLTKMVLFRGDEEYFADIRQFIHERIECGRV